MFEVKTDMTAGTDHDALLIGLFADDRELTGVAKTIDDQLEGHLSSLLKDKQIKKSHKAVTKVFTLGKSEARQVYFLGLGKKADFGEETLREAVAAGFRHIHKDKPTDVAIAFDSLMTDTFAIRETAHVITELFGLTSYHVADYKEKTNEIETVIEAVTFYSQQDLEAVRAGITSGKVYARGTNLARALVNTPANLMTPTDLAEQATEIAERHQLEIDILEREDMEKLGMGSLLAVASGSDEPPKMIVLKFQGKSEWDDVLCFVGKGLTFDSGGISIKPKASMHEMKMDMGGGAAVLGAMDVIGELKPDANVLAVIPATENLLNGSALKPGDVIRSMNGKTIEVRNTDAEGRLILADGVTYAKQLGASRIVDVATLTGAVLVALGEWTTGAVTNDETFVEEVLEAGYTAGEWIWRLPAFTPYKELLKTSDVADLNNSPGRMAGSITAGLFIGEFAEDTPWVHLDIAGTAWASKPSAIGPKGGTGAMVRTLANLARSK
ncbi:leucyl aminopeptidase [Desertibacillus haloalkaliphilus]|uniref:leucyl aminopeptidase n=1 Tax=Desertibacillus haloalkaliphilus TaxID=1328930 RepID=UPI001C255887|nr:leucyl aminopeptidase [Desertibacillus haloalkaliphilus]MBU8905378.1 leucyl aminopeptidase [Desertibacillus haloalkaliphilus]